MAYSDKITYMDVKKSYTELKARTDLVCHLWLYCLRPISFGLAVLFINMGFSPTSITALGVPIAVLAAAFMLFGQVHSWCYLVGGMLFNLWILLDCVDGDMARATNQKSKAGGLLDFFSGQLHHGLTPIAIAVSFLIGNAKPPAFYPSSWPMYGLVIIAGIEVFTGMLRALVSFKAKHSFGYVSGAKPENISLRMMLPRAPINFVAPIFLVAYPLNMLFLYLFVYMIYNVVTCVGVVVRCMQCAQKYDQESKSVGGEMVQNVDGRVIWLTGISGAGKTTIALRLIDELRKRHERVDLLDGDIVRDFFEGDLGYSREERIQNVRRIAFAAKVLADQGVIVVVANIAPYYEVRDFIRRKIDKYVQVYVKASLDEVKSRDVKGHYKKFATGATNNLVGVDDVYDVPRNPDLVLDTDTESVDESLGKIVDFLKKKGV